MSAVSLCVWILSICGWFTSEYIQTTGSAPWRTHIASVKLRDCGTPVDTSPTVAITSPAQGATVFGSITVSADATDNVGVTQVEFFADGASVGVDTNSTDGWSASWNTTTTGDGSHTVSATATDTIGQTGVIATP